MRYSMVFLCVLFSIVVYSQNTQPQEILPITTTTNFITGLTKKFDQLQTGITKSTHKMLSRLEKQEAKLERKLRSKDSTKAAVLFGNSQERFAQLHQKLDSTSNGKPLKEYIAKFDTLKTTLGFLEKHTAQGSINLAKLNEAKKELQQFEVKLQAANEIKKIIRERKQQLAAKLKEYGLDKQMKKLNKEVYYYQQQINEYKTYLTDTKKFEQKAIALLRDNAGFKAFMAKNSMLAQLFKLPDNYGTPQSLAGLQTITNVQQTLNQRTVAGGPNAMQLVRQNVTQAQTELNKLKAKLKKGSFGNSSNTEVPDFKPNTQKTKRFLQRVEYGLIIQSQRGNSFLPNSSDIALTAGYRLNDKSVIGVGLSYKMGFGTGWNNIQLSNEGIGIRTYMDVKFKGSFWLSGGYERNYLQSFRKLEELTNINAWQQSGLLGITKKFKLGKKKTSNIQLLWDFLSYGQIPQAEAFKFRVGYGF